MEYFLTNSGRKTRDFYNIFREFIHISGVLENEELAKSLGLQTVVKLPVLESQKIIVCEAKRNNKREFSVYGTYGKDWEYAEDFFFMLDEAYAREFSKGRDIYIYGAGNSTRVFLHRIQIPIQGIIDSDSEKSGSFLQGKIQVFSPDVVNLKDHFIFVCSIHYEEIAEFLEKRGGVEGVDFSNISRIDIWPSEMMKLMFEEQDIRDYKCSNPMEEFELHAGGYVKLCCKMNYSVGNLYDLDFNTIERSIKRKLFIISVLNGTFSFCKKKNSFCLTLEKQKISRDEHLYSVPEQVCSKTIEAAFDPSCNLYCSSCRNSRYIAHSSSMMKLTRRFIQEMLPKADILRIAGNGEAFFSKYYRQIFESEEIKAIGKIEILSNGNICDKQMWNYLSDITDGNLIAQISVDAAREGTYRSIRRGGELKKVEYTLAFLSMLKEKNKIKHIRLNFVIQRENYKELADFIEWGIGYGADDFFITQIENWGSYDEDTFQNICMYDTEHVEKFVPELEKELKRIMQYRDIISMDQVEKHQRRCILWGE